MCADDRADLTDDNLLCTEFMQQRAFQHFRSVMGICVRIYVLEYGQIIAKGTPEEIQKNPEVIRAYLGGDA